MTRNHRLVISSVVVVLSVLGAAWWMVRRHPGLPGEEAALWGAGLGLVWSVTLLGILYLLERRGLFSR